jgi:ADP-ribose pyrophosphatase
MKPKLEKSELIHKGFCDLRIDTLKKEGGDPTPYLVLSTKVDAVAILAKDDKKRFLLNREYRHPVGKYLLTCPGGRMEKGEDPKESAARELLEETGYEAKELHLIGTYYPLPSLCDQKVFLYFAPFVQKRREQNLDPIEFITPVSLTKKELLLEVHKSDIDGVLAAALFYHFGQGK